MKKALTVSIVIPAYNEEAYIGACLQAIARQTVAPDEVIVVDNNSADETVDIARRFPFVRIVHEKRQGLYYSRQRGMREAKGDILCRIDADTLVDEGWVEAIQTAFASSKVNALTGPVGYYDFMLPRFGRMIEDRALRGAMAFGYDFVFGCNMAVRRTVWHKIHSQLCKEPYLMEDMDITAHLGFIGIRPVYASGMSAMVSCRRLADRPRSFWQYMTGHSRTARHHDLSTFGAHYAEFMFFLAYLLIKPWHMWYDPQNKRLSLRQFLTAATPRPDPMALNDK